MFARYTEVQSTSGVAADCARGGGKQGRIISPAGHVTGRRLWRRPSLAWTLRACAAEEDLGASARSHSLAWFPHPEGGDVGVGHEARPEAHGQAVHEVSARGGEAPAELIGEGASGGGAGGGEGGAAGDGADGERARAGWAGAAARRGGAAAAALDALPEATRARRP